MQLDACATHMESELIGVGAFADLRGTGALSQVSIQAESGKNKRDPQPRHPIGQHEDLAGRFTQVISDSRQALSKALGRP